MTKNKTYKPLVVKIGSSTLTHASADVDRAYLDKIAEQLARVRDAGFSPIVVTSAAIACGLRALQMNKRPSDMPSLQAAASVGQGVLASAYAKAFEKQDLLSSLVLLTRRDTADRSAYLHARDTMMRLLELGVVPIVNENDTVSIEQIRFGDNDTLAALVACLVDAKLVVILSDIDGLFDADPRKNPDAKLISEVKQIDSHIMELSGQAGSALGSGGMITKIRAARVLMAAGIEMVICNGKAKDAIVRAASNESIGTRFLCAKRPHEITPKKLWIALGDTARGYVEVDEGAKRALMQSGSSLLCVGALGVGGEFVSGDIIDVRDTSGFVFARGKVAFARDEIELACGKTSSELERNHLLSLLATRPIIHRDELIVFE